ncbi:uracil-DNA glycosylase [Patescibacteria group bacterium]|nr:uracil-DNA glycosylase [Patescibacteria group bacterium]
MTPAQKLFKLHQKYDDANTCDLKTTATQAVFGDGSPIADIVFIGEAPGKKEDLEGKPFIGAAGKFLDEMLGSIGMTRGRASTDGARHDFAKSDVYITNVVKYRPPNNRDPLPEEKEACRAWLEAELTLINPKLIVFLGRHAMSNFFPEEKISSAHGKLINKKIPGIATTYFLPLYHPAAALYNGGLRQELLKDFKQIPLTLKKISKTN